MLRRRVFHVLSSLVPILFLGSFAAAQAPVHSQNFNAGAGGYTASSLPLAQPGGWIYSGADGVGGTGAFRANGSSTGTLGEQFLTSPVIALPGKGPAILNFDHLYNFENDDTTSPPTITRWDGGVLEISVNGGSFTQVPAANFTLNGYDGTLSGASSVSGVFGLVDVFNGSSNQPDPLNPPFAGDVPGSGTFQHSTATLGIFSPGDSLQFRFRGGWDEAINLSPGWIIDNIQLTQTPEPTSCFAFAMAGLVALAGMRKLARRRR